MDKPNYFGILPATVRYSKEVSAFAKILFAEVTALSNKNGFCNASNSKFAELFDVSETTISKTLTSLDKAGFLKVDIERNSSGTFRKIFPLVDTYGRKLQGGLKKTSRGVEENCKGGLKKTARQKNNTSNNNTSNNKSEETPTTTPPSSDNWSKLDITLHNYKMPFSERLNKVVLDYWRYMSDKKEGKFGSVQTIKRQVESIQKYLHKFTEQQIIDSIEEAIERGNVQFNPQWTINRKKNNKNQPKKTTYSLPKTISNA